MCLRKQMWEKVLGVTCPWNGACERIHCFSAAQYQLTPFTTRRGSGGGGRGWERGHFLVGASPQSLLWGPASNPPFMAHCWFPCFYFIGEAGWGVSLSVCLSLAREGPVMLLTPGSLPLQRNPRPLPVRTSKASSDSLSFPRSPPRAPLPPT